MRPPASPAPSFPSGVTATPETEPEWPSSVRKARPLSSSRTFNVLSPDALEGWRPAMASGYSAKRFEENRENCKLCHLKLFEFFHHSGRNYLNCRVLLSGMVYRISPNSCKSKIAVNRTTLGSGCKRKAIGESRDRCERENKGRAFE